MGKTQIKNALPRLKEKYQKEVIPALIQEFSYDNPVRAPHIMKIVVNAGIGEAVQNVKMLDGVVEEMKQICGQQPLVTKSKKAIASYKLREGKPIGGKVTLRGN